MPFNSVKFNNSVARVNEFTGECQFNRGACQSKLGLGAMNQSACKFDEQFRLK